MWREPRLTTGQWQSIAALEQEQTDRENELEIRREHDRHYWFVRRYFLRKRLERDALTTASRRKGYG